MLAEIPHDQTPNAPNPPPHPLITDEQVSCAPSNFKNGSATALGGIPYELRKVLHAVHPKKPKSNKPSFDVHKCLRIVYCEIQTEEQTRRGNSTIVALDQEKAYDKIDHKRPLDGLKAFRLPDLFVNIVRADHRDHVISTRRLHPKDPPRRSIPGSCDLDDQ